MAKAAEEADEDYCEESEWYSKSRQPESHKLRAPANRGEGTAKWAG